MASAIKEELMALLPSEDVAAEVVLEEPPVAEEFCTCPDCGHPAAEVWSSPDAYVANCPECHLEFTPVIEGMKLKITAMMERRRQQRKKRGSVRAGFSKAKAEILQMMS